MLSFLPIVVESGRNGWFDQNEDQHMIPSSPEPRGWVSSMYNYLIVVSKGENVYVTSCTPPEQFYANTVSLLGAVGVHQQDMVIYLRQDNKPCVKVTSAIQNVLSTSEDDTVKAHEVLGAKIADAYKVLYRKYQYLSIRHKTPVTDQKIAQLKRFLNVVDSSVVDVKINKNSESTYNDVVEVWLRKQYSPENCSRALNYGRRTWYRITNKLCKHLAYSLETQMSMDELHTFLNEGTKSKDWTDTIEDLETFNVSTI